MEGRYESRKALFKGIDTNSLEKRRKSAKAESEESKRLLMKSLREAAMSAIEKEGPEELRTRKLFSRTFMYYDTMLSVPMNLESDWLVALRPEGQRCLAVLQGNALSLRQRNGQLIDSFVLDPFSIKRTDQVAIFDCMLGFSNKTMKRTLFVTDVVQLKGNDLYMSDFTFRQYFLKEHWPFTPSGSAPMLMGLEDDSIPEFERIEFGFATHARIQSLYSAEGSGYSSDSLLFIHKEGKYTNGLSQEALIFRDENLSRFAIDSKHEDGFDGGESMAMVLRAAVKKKKGSESIVKLETWDGISLHEMKLESAPGWMKSTLAKRPWMLVRCEVDNNFEFTKMQSSGKPFPHSFNRIVDQFRKRRLALNLPPTENEIFDAPPLSIESLLSSP